MATINISDVSDGEIVDEVLSEISSEEDYFEKVEKRVQKQLSEVNKRKTELELQNTVNGFGKENYNHKRRPSTKRKRKLSYESSRELARRSYRASSVFSNYSLPKRKKREKTRKNTEKRVKYEVSEDSASEKLEESEDDEELQLMDLRLQALKSKQEVKELIEEVTQPAQTIQEPSEEENLRILALKSAVLKKKEFFKERKKQKMLENERPYSPSDVLPEIEMDMSLSPLGSPFNEIENQEVDMDISNDEKESSDMDLAPSPQIEVENDEDERALREQLLSSIKKKEEVAKEKSPEDSSGSEQKMLAKSLKIVVQRLRQKKPPPIPIPSKSGTKTIAMILAEQKGKKNTKRPTKDTKINTNKDTEVIKEKKIKLDDAKKPDLHPESFLIRTIVNDFVPQIPQATEIPQIITETQPPSPQDSFSTITDTKNIPLLRDSQTDEAKKSRLVTSLEHVIKPVSRLIIPVRDDDSDTEEERKSVRKTPKRIVRAPTKKQAVQPEFEKNLENFLKNIRKEHEKKNETEPEMSSVKHLPKSQQVEYQQLVQKLKVLEEAKEKALKARQMKRSKSNSEQMKPPAPVKVMSPKKPVVALKTNDKIADSLSKIPQLDKAAQLRFIEKTENNFRNHSDKLLAATEQSLKLLQTNEDDLKKQELLTAQIAELEKRLKRSKANLIAVNQRVKVNLHKIVQSSKEMIKFRVHQRNFGKHICLPAGRIIKGDGYSLPDHMSKEIDENFTTIADKTEEISRKSFEANVKLTIKSVADRVRSFVPEEENRKRDLGVKTVEESGKREEKQAENEEELEKIDKNSGNSSKNSLENSKSPENSEISKKSENSENQENTSKYTEIDEEDSEVMKMIKEDSENPPSKLEIPGNIDFPDIQKKMRGILDSGGGSSMEQKLKYESPLDFLRAPKNKYERN